MGQIVVDVGSFDLTSHNGNTAYSSVRYFDIPANAGITGCVATFTTHVNTGNFQGKSFSLNGVQAHPNTPWPTSGISLNSSLLSTGQNTFRAAVKSQAGLSARWSIGSITLTITYTDVGGGGTPPPPSSYIGAMNVTPTTITAGGTINIAVGACDANIGRHIVVYRTDAYGILNAVATYHGSAAASWNVDILVDWCAYSPNSARFQIRVEYHTYDIFSGLDTGTINQMVNVDVPGSIVPTFSAFSIIRDANGVDGSITGHVQNYTKINLSIEGAAGAYGSSIVSRELSGGGFYANAASASFGPFTQSGEIHLTAKVTDSRGRVTTQTETIEVLSYNGVFGTNIEAYRSDASKAPANEGLFATLKCKNTFSLLGGQNAGTVKGRVYEKGTTPTAWTTMANDTLVLFGGSLSIEKAYTADIQVADLITSYQYSIDIPTATVIMGIAPNGDGVSFGTYPEAGKVLSVWPFICPDGACPGINDILITLNTVSPATRFPGTTWATIGGVFLLGADATYTAGATGGEATHTLSVSEIAEHAHYNKTYVGSYTGSGAYVAGTEGSSLGYGTASQTAAAGGGAPHNNMPPYLVVYMWERTA